MEEVDKVESDWTSKVMETFRNLEKRDRPLTVRHKDILAPLNLDTDYKYCLGNPSIENALRKLNDTRFARTQSIRS